MFQYADGFEGPQFESDVRDVGSGSEETEYTIKAQTGINTGDGNFEIIEIGKSDVYQTTNVGIPGVWMYQINEGSVIKPSKETMCCL